MTHTPLDLTQLGPGDLILTPNRRLSAWLQRDYDEIQRTRQRLKTWHALRTQPLDSWFLEQYNRLALVSNPALPRLLSPLQVRSLWQKHLTNVVAEPNHLEGLIQLCQQARTLICRWHLPSTDWNLGESEENRVFAAAHQQFLEDLREHHWIDPAGLPRLIHDRWGTDLCEAERVFLHGFNDLQEPQLTHLESALTAAGIEVCVSGQHRQQGHSGTLSFVDYGAQFKAALSWAVQQHFAWPLKRFAIVIPNLQHQRLHLEKLCADLVAAYPDRLADDWRHVINITAGQPLSSFSLCSHLLLMLKALGGNLRLAEWEVLLKSPFFSGGVQHFQMRDAFIVWLRSKNRAFLNWCIVHELWKVFSASNSPTEAEPFPLFKVSDRTLAQRGQTTSLRNWLVWLNRILAALGWLQERTLDSESYQVNQRVQETLQSLTELDAIMDPIRYAGFLNEVSQALKAVTFQPQTETAPIQVMGVLEAAAMNFDGLWVCECESRQWPQPVSANPLLPRSTLRRYGMPGSGPDRELEYARTILDGFAQAAPQVVFSWGEYEGDSQLLMSPLLEPIAPITDFTVGMDFVSQEERRFQLAGLLSVDAGDDLGTELQSQSSRGGSGVIQAQSLCPFKAYAEYRLGIRSEDNLQEGIKASDRGSLVHRVLESFWREITDYHGLAQLIARDNELQSVLNQILGGEMARFRQETYLQPEALYQLERERTFQSVYQWLRNAELTRAPFKVENIEKRQTVSLAGMELTLTVDRIDVLEDGSRAIIDYKTGIKNTASWLGPRPEEPQLPLYALINPEHTKGIYFGIIRPEKAEWQGLQDHNVQFTERAARTVKSPTAGWADQVGEWRQTLEQLALEYQQGVASVTPLNNQVCQYCHLSPVCRIKEQHRDRE